MKTFLLGLISIVFVYGVTGQATEILAEQPATEVKIFKKVLVVRTWCEVHPGGERGGSKYEAFCMCSTASGEIEQVVRKAFPTMKEMLFPAPADLNQPLNECGVKPLDVQGTVVFTN